jgi:tetratricopeptide (TPR) repeat protein
MNPDETLSQAERQLAGKDFAGAERTLSEAWPDMTAAPGDAQHALAVVRIAQRRYGEAEQLLRSAAAAEPGSLRHPIALGHLLTGGNHHVAAMEAYAQAMRIDPKWPGLVVVYAQSAYKSGRYDEAEKAARHWIAAEPSAGAYDTLSCALREQGKAQEALAAAEDALRTNPKHMGANHSRAAALLALGRHQEALQLFDALIAAGANAPALYLNRDKALLALKREREAAETFAEGARRFPADDALQQAAARR